MTQRRTRTRTTQEPVIVGQSEYVVGDKKAALARRIKRAFDELGSVVYYLRDGDLIKIGYSANFRTRRRAFNSDLTAILALVPGDMDLEQRIHDQFASARAKRDEWYYPTPALVAHINGIREELGVPPIDVSTW